MRWQNHPSAFLVWLKPAPNPLDRLCSPASTSPFLPPNSPSLQTYQDLLFQHSQLFLDQTPLCLLDSYLRNTLCWSPAAPQQHWRFPHRLLINHVSLPSPNIAYIGTSLWKGSQSTPLISTFSQAIPKCKERRRSGCSVQFSSALRSGAILRPRR
jgi:hypothetical protein